MDTLALSAIDANACFFEKKEDVTPQVLASILQLHPDVIVFGDEAAFSKIKDKL